MRLQSANTTRTKPVEFDLGNAMSTSLNSFKSLQQLDVAGKTYHYFDLQAASAQIGDVSRLPKSLKVLLENLLRFEDNVSVKADDIKAIAAWLQSKSSKQ